MLRGWLPVSECIRPMPRIYSSIVLREPLSVLPQHQIGETESSVFAPAKSRAARACPFDATPRIVCLTHTYSTTHRLHTGFGDLPAASGQSSDDWTDTASASAAPGVFNRRRHNNRNR